MREKLGIETILIIVAIIIVAIFLILALAGKGKSSLVENTQTSSLSELIQKANDPDILKFNSKFRIAEGSSQPGTTVKNLISRIDENNSTEDRKVTIVGEQNIDTSLNYSVSFEYDTDGYINVVKIEKNK